MASLATACRLSARLVARRGPADSSIRGFTTSARCLAAQNFTMPALSPTMTEGNIATWKVKEGESFSAGDVLLEIETDKATMDVEAQEDGVVAKIISGDGSKSVQVGTRIAVIAEPGDDLSSLEIPSEEPAQQQARPSPTKEGTESEGGSESKDTAPRQPAPLRSDGKKHEQKYPLYPSVQHLARLHNIDPETLSRITPTGPQGRLLKGDVLAYLGTINAETPAKVSERFTTLSQLDLSNIKVAPAPAKEAAPTTTEPKPAAEPPAPEPESEVIVPLSLAKVAETQRRIQDTLGVHLPLATFLARAAEVANDDLPPSTRPPTADELFNQVLGLDKLQPRGSSRGYFLPQVDALPESAIRAASAAPAPAPRNKPADIIDILAGTAKKTKPASGPSVSETDTNVVSVTVPKYDEKRARVFLERVKVILEQEPGRLVL